jgi:hypothetical protein
MSEINKKHQGPIVLKPTEYTGDITIDMAIVKAVVKALEQSGYLDELVERKIYKVKESKSAIGSPIKSADVDYWREQIDQAQRQPFMSSNKINLIWNFFQKFEPLDDNFKSKDLTPDLAWALDKLFKEITEINAVLDLDVWEF